MNDEIKQKSKEAAKGLLEEVLAVVGLSIFFVFRFLKNTLKGVFGFIIGAIGLYIWLGLIGLALLWGLDAILHAFLEH